MSAVNIIYSVLAILIAAAIISIAKTHFIQVKLRDGLILVKQILKRLIKLIDKAIKAL